MKRPASQDLLVDRRPSDGTGGAARGGERRRKRKGPRRVPPEASFTPARFELRRQGPPAGSHRHGGHGRTTPAHREKRRAGRPMHWTPTIENTGGACQAENRENRLSLLEGVAGVGVAGVVAALEPAHALGRGPVGEAFGDHLPLGGPLQLVVADGAGRV